MAKRRGRPRKKRTIAKRKPVRRRRRSHTRTVTKIVKVPTMARKTKRKRRRGRPAGSTNKVSRVRRRRRSGTRRHSKSLFGLGSLGRGLMPNNALLMAGCGALGVLGVGFTMAKITSQTNAPAWIKDGWGRIITEGAVAVLGGRLLRHVTSKQTADAVMAGALIWTALDGISMLRFGTVNPALRMKGLIDDSPIALMEAGSSAALGNADAALGDYENDDVLNGVSSYVGY